MVGVGVYPRMRFDRDAGARYAGSLVGGASLVLLLAACGGDAPSVTQPDPDPPTPSQPTATHEVFGRVYTNANRSKTVPGVTVELAGQTLVTNDAGDIYFKGVPAGDRVIRLTSSRYATLEQTIAVNGSTNLRYFYPTRDAPELIHFDVLRARFLWVDPAGANALPTHAEARVTGPGLDQTITSTLHEVRSATTVLYGFTLPEFQKLVLTLSNTRGRRAEYTCQRETCTETGH